MINETLTTSLNHDRAELDRSENPYTLAPPSLQKKVGRPAQVNKLNPSDVSLLKSYQQCWPKFAKDVLRVSLDSAQEAILESVRTNRRTVVRSGHARGKDYVSAVAAICHLLLIAPSKTILTAPTGRQVIMIMMSEVSTIWKNANQYLEQYGMNLGGVLQSARILIPGSPNHFLEGFKAQDKAVEAWTGFHSPNLLLVVTEASGIDDVTYNAVEGILTGDSHLLLVGNPNCRSGEFYRSFASSQYHKFTLNCLQAPNVLAKKTLVPGQVDYPWVAEKIAKPGWTTKISPEEAAPSARGDFLWEGEWYQPSDLFRMKVLGEFPLQDVAGLVPLEWIQKATDRWHERNTPAGIAKRTPFFDPESSLQRPPSLTRLGIDVAGMGNDLTAMAVRTGTHVESLRMRAKQDHMTTVGEVIELQKRYPGSVAYIDTIGEGAGVYSRLQELKSRVVSVKGSMTAKYERDSGTGQRKFANMRAYLLWAVRDALDEELGGTLSIPPDDELIQELTETRWRYRSDGSIEIEPKDDLKQRIGRSPDRCDAIALTFAPMEYEASLRVGTLEGLGIPGM